MTAIRSALGAAIGLVAALEGGTDPAHAHQAPAAERPRVAATAMATFIAALRRDEALRSRFAAEPQAVIREHGIDPAPYNLDGLDEGGRRRLLLDLAQQTDSKPPQPPPPPDTRGPPVTPLPPYGPPPTPKPKPPEPDGRKTAPAPVYGPPPQPR